MNAFTLKIIALTSMIIDHMGVVFPDQFGFEFRVIGRLAFPIYVYLVAEGFKHTKSPAKFLTRLFVFAIISQPVFQMALRGIDSPWNVSFFTNTNIFYTLLFGGAAIVVYKYLHKLTLNNVAVLPLFLFMWLAKFFSSDYGAYGVMFVFVMYWIGQVYNGKVPKCIQITVMAALCLWQHNAVIRFALSGYAIYIPILTWMLIPATLLPVLLVVLYNGKRGPSLKWFFYTSYPIHLAVLAIVRAG